jgi:transcriptional regulator with XRE-family HTH domain
MASAEQLKELRSRLGITTREVAELSERLAQEEGNDEFYISNAWLTQIENSDSVPSIHKIYSLSVIYHVKFADLLRLFGVHVESIAKRQMTMALPQSHLTPVETFDDSKSVTFPVRFDRGFDMEKTNLVSRMVEIWGEVPVALIQHLDVRHSLYGYIGAEDFTLHPMLRPGSFVQIDQTNRKILASKWRSEYDRPIYFIELRGGYACSWCELQGNQLLLVPHPLSPCRIRAVNYGSDAEIVGQVTGVAMRIVDVAERAGDAPARLPRQS